MPDTKLAEWFANANMSDIATVGGKGASLGEMFQKLSIRQLYAGLKMSMFGFVILSAVAQIPTFEKIKAFKKDPLNMIMRAFGVLCLCFGLFSYYFDRPVTSVCIFYTLWIAAYVAAPSRRYQTASQACRDMSGKTVMVTGCTSGIGVDTVKALAKRGAHVYMVARSAEKLKRLKDSIKGKCETIVCDLSDLKAVRNCAKIFLSDVSSGKISGLDVLILNAGVMALKHRQETQQGFEKQVGVNHIAHYTLTKLLLPALQKSAPSRIVSVSSSAHRMCDPVYILDQQNVNLETIPYDPWIAYVVVVFERERHQNVNHTTDILQAPMFEEYTLVTFSKISTLEQQQLSKTQVRKLKVLERSLCGIFESNVCW